MQIGTVLLLFVGLAIAILFMGFKVVPQGYQWTVERFGRYTNTLKPGLNIIIPVMDRIGRKINVMESVLDIPPQEVITADNATVQIDAVCFFQVVNTAQAAYEVNNLEHAIRNLLQTNIRTVLGSMELDAMLSQRDGINEKLLRTVDEATAPWGIKITRIEIKDISPPADLMAAMSGQMKAERIKRAQILEAEGLRASAILTAEGKKQAQILEAEGRRQGEILRAEGDKQAAVLRAQGEAEAIETVFQAIHRGDADEKLLAYQYLQTLPKIADSASNKLWIIPSEFTEALKGVSGAFGAKSTDAAPRGPRPTSL